MKSISYLNLTNSIKQELGAIAIGKRSYRELRSLLLKANKARFLTLRLPCFCRTVEEKEYLKKTASGFLTTGLASKSVLKDRGWTQYAIAKAELKPDKIVQSDSGRSINLYSLHRVMYFESRPDIALLLERSTRDRRDRVANRTDLIEQQKQKALQWVESCDIAVPDYSINSLLESAIALHNDACQDSGEYERFYSLSTTPPMLLARVCVRYIRTQMPSYHANIELLFGSVGKDASSFALRKKINDAIELKYPDLESQIQKHRESRSLA